MANRIYEEAAAEGAALRIVNYLEAAGIRTAAQAQGLTAAEREQMAKEGPNRKPIHPRTWGRVLAILRERETLRRAS